jgi:hypothetical protein
MTILEEQLAHASKITGVPAVEIAKICLMLGLSPSRDLPKILTYYRSTEDK